MKHPAPRNRAALRTISDARNRPIVDWIPTADYGYKGCSIRMRDHEFHFGQII